MTRDLLAEVVSFKALYEALSKLVQDAVIEVDVTGRVARWNLAAEVLTGHAAQSTIGQPLSGLVAEHEFDAVNSVPQDGAAHDVRLTFLQPSGKNVQARGRCVALKSGASLDGWLIACESARGADEIEQLKNEFVSTVSHELRTPLAAIKAYGSTLLANPALAEPERSEYLRIIEEQTDRLARLVDDLLLVTRVEAGQMLKRRVRVQLDSILDRVVEQLSFDRDRYSLERHTEGVWLSGDPDRLTDIFSHLIDNAVKYMPHGGSISVTAQERDAQTFVSIRDHGIGMENDQLAFIFDRFYRIESDATSAIGGNGLGLFLVHALVRAHGGTIDVRSEPGEGSTFTVALPVRA